MSRLAFQTYGEWVVEEVDECTGGGCCPEYGHEPGCGFIPLEELGQDHFDGSLLWDFSEAGRDYNPPNPPMCESWVKAYDESREGIGEADPF